MQEFGGQQFTHEARGEHFVSHRRAKSARTKLQHLALDLCVESRVSSELLPSSPIAPRAILAAEVNGAESIFSVAEVHHTTVPAGSARHVPVRRERGVCHNSVSL